MGVIRKIKKARKGLEDYVEELPRNAFTAGYERPMKSAPRRKSPAKKYIIRKGKIYKAVETSKKKKKKKDYYDPWSF